MTEETTTEQLVEIEGQAESTAATEYTPPDGWRVLAVGERLRDGDLWVNHQGGLWPTKRVGETVNDERYIRRIESQPEPQPEPQPQPEPCAPCDSRDTCDTPATEYTPPEGWRVLRYGELLQPGDHWVNWEGTVSRPDIQHGDGATVSGGRYIRWVKPQPQPEAQPNAAAIEELRSEVSYVQRLLGESNRKVAQLEDLVASLRTINEGAEKAVSGAGVVNDSLRLQLAAVKAELASVAADRQRLQIELDAAHQVPADSPELRQLRADLAEVAHDRDTYRHAHELLVQDIDATHQRTKAMTVEAICEWIEPIRREDPHLRAVILFHLPKIMRSLAGLNTPEDVD